MTMEQCPQTDSHRPILRGCAPLKQGEPKKEENFGPGIWAPSPERSKGNSKDGGEGSSGVKSTAYNRPTVDQGDRELQKRWHQESNDMFDQTESTIGNFKTVYVYCFD